MNLNNELTQLSKFRPNMWVEVNDDARGTYNNNSQIESKTKMLKIFVLTVTHTYL